MKKNKKSLMAALSVLLFFTITGVFMVRNKLTYLEFTTVNEESNTYIELNQTGEELIQEFYMPYDIMKGFSLKIGTFARDNNSEWDVLITDAETNSIIYTDHFNASLISDNDYHYIKFDKNIRLVKNSLYKIHILANHVNHMTGLAFYGMDQPIEGHSEELYYNGSSMQGMLCFKIYGGDIDDWWIRLILFFAAVFSFVVIRIHLLKDKGINPTEDLVLQSLAIGLLAFLLLFSFAVSGTFSDEFDNMRGGMIIAKGGVLYKDYVTQHTPVTYYLCSIFALLGAGSVQQFRLSYYIFEAAVWALLYFRHESYFGKRKMLVLSILECIFIASIISPQGSQILSDGVQGLCMVVLSLEFIRYYKDKKLDWVRSIILSISIWGSFGSVFISVYALIWAVLVFLAVEIKDWTTQKFSVKLLAHRYWKLLIAVITPCICAIIYFKANHSLKRAFDQFYTFNREVYSKYTGGMGEKLRQPFINAIQNFFDIIANNVNSIVIAQADNVTVLQLIIIVLATIVIILLIVDKRRTEAVLLFMVMCCSATRGYGFHGLAAWYVAVMLIAIFYDKMLNYLPNISMPFTGAIVIFMTSIYVTSIGNNLLYEQEAVSEIESRVVAMTEQGEGILIDVYSCDNLYFLYKGRYPVNRAAYMLPWYMDWYEQDTIDDLQNNKPNIVVYYEDVETWGHTHYANAFAAALKEKYSRISDNPDDGWRYSVWTKK